MGTEIRGILSVTTSKKGAKVFAAKYENKKGKTVSMPIQPQYRAFDEAKAADGDELIITLNDTGQFTKVSIPGKEKALPQPKPAPAPRHNEYRGGGYSYRGNVRFGGRPLQGMTAREANLPPATAPYNFVPLSKVLKAEPIPDDAPRYSGTIHCSLTTLRPLLVSGASSKNDADNRNQNTEKIFFTIGGRPAIPGSSLKGLLRSQIEILSSSFMKPVNERPLFWRNMDDRDYYMSRMGIGDQARQKAGYLFSDHGDWKIRPVAFRAVLSTYSPAPSGKMLVKTGDIPRKRHDYLFDLPDRSAGPDIIVPDETWKDFILQLTPAQEAHSKKTYGINPREMKKGEYLPVFYLETEQGGLDFFGLAKYFRYKTKHTVGALRDSQTDKPGEGRLDFATRLFGCADNTLSLRGRVAVSAAVFPSDTKTEGPYKVVLGQPHETCVAHYMQQNPDSVRTLPKNINRLDIKTMSNYISGGHLRGRKMYWHRDVEITPPPNANEKVAAYLRPLSAGARTTFEIHLSSVTLEELGAVLEAFELPEGHALKLGMGKPLGFGSIRIVIDGFDVADDHDRYGSLAARCRALLSGKKSGQDNITSLRKRARDAFRLWVLKAMGRSNAQPGDYDSLPDIRTLRRMTDFVNRPGNAETRNMDLTEFRNLHILQDALEIKPGKCR